MATIASQKHLVQPNSDHFFLKNIYIYNTRVPPVSAVMDNTHYEENITYVAGSNMLLSIKHCVAIGGATCGCGVTRADPAPINTEAAAGGICRTG